MMVMKSLLLQIGVLLFLIDGCLSIPKIKPRTDIYANESLPIGHVFGPFYVEDLDSSGPFQIHLTYREDNFLNLTTDGINFTLTLNRTLDYDRVFHNKRHLEYVGIDIDGIEVTMYFQIQDANDEFPEFKNLPYTVNIDENSSPQLIKTVSASDRDEADKNKLTYTLEAQAKNSESMSKFKMNNSRDGKIYLTGSLDYEKVKFYHYFVIAHDTVGHETTADVYITVNDLQDSAPYFTGTPYRGHVDENTPRGSSTNVNIRAFDGDTGMPNPVNYSIINDTCNNSFSINSTSGLILVQKILDTDGKMLIDNTGQCELTVKAQEICIASTGTPQPNCQPANSSTTTVTITVNDLNDNSPVFNSDHYNGSINENSPQGIPVTFSSEINVSDIDQGHNSVFNLSIEPEDIFEIVPRTVRSSASVSIRVKNKAALDYEKNQTFILKMKAVESKTSEKLNDTATVTINLININDNDPVFQNDSYEIHLLENIAPGTRVINVTATDGDRGTFGEITYSFQTPVNGFNITTANNIGQVILTGTLDRETRSTYYLAVVAEDGGGLKSRSQLTITVKDVNDNAPIFLQTSYAANIKETSKQFSPSLTVSATDADIRQNGNITYSIKSAFPQNVRANFSIDAFTGNISVNQGLDYESLNDTKGQITLNVTASDQGSPQLTATVTVSITVQDENDNSPKFDKNPFFAEVKENATSATDKLANTTTNNGYVQRADIVCTSTSMEISIPATLLPRHNATLRDPACLVRFNGTHHVIDIGLDQCGTTVEISEDSIIFRNELSAHVTNALFPPDVTFGDNGEAFIPLQCEYPRRANVSLEYLPLHHTLRIFERGFGRLDFELRQFKDNEYVTEIASDSLPAKIPLNDQLHVALSLGRSSLTNLGIFVDGCIATPMPSPNYPVFRQLIKNGCASEPEVRVDQSKSLSEFRWSFNVFKFTSTSPVSSPQLVYVHCQVSVCRPSQCAPSCHLTRRRRRGLAQRHSSHLISTGPFVVMKEQDSSNSPAAVVVSTCVAAVACVVAMVAVVAWKRNKGKGYRLVPQTPKE